MTDCLIKRKRISAVLFSRQYCADSIGSCLSGMKYFEKVVASTGNEVYNCSYAA